MLDHFVQHEMQFPSPRKVVNGHVINNSRPLNDPESIGGFSLGGFGAAVAGDKKRNHDAQPAEYRSPEVMLGADWSYPVDIWNVGALVSQRFSFSALYTTDSVSRYGLCSREGTSFRATTRKMVGIPRAPILRRWPLC